VEPRAGLDDVEKRKFLTAIYKFRKVSRCVTGEVAPVLNYALSHEDVWGKGCIYPRIIDLATSWR
jgi:hypothetical protein